MEPVAVVANAGPASAATSPIAPDVAPRNVQTAPQESERIAMTFMGRTNHEPSFGDTLVRLRNIMLVGLRNCFPGYFPPTSETTAAGGNMIGCFFPTFSAALPISADAFNAEVDGINKIIEAEGTAPPISDVYYFWRLISWVGAILIASGFISFFSSIASTKVPAIVTSAIVAVIGMMLSACGSSGCHSVHGQYMTTVLPDHKTSVMMNIVTPVCAKLTSKYRSEGISWSLEATKEQRAIRGHIVTYQVNRYSLVVTSATPAVQAVEAEFPPNYATAPDLNLSVQSPESAV